MWGQHAPRSRSNLIQTSVSHWDGFVKPPSCLVSGRIRFFFSLDTNVECGRLVLVFLPQIPWTRPFFIILDRRIVFLRGGVGRILRVEREATRVWTGGSRLPGRCDQMLFSQSIVPEGTSTDPYTLGIRVGTNPWDRRNSSTDKVIRFVPRQMFYYSENMSPRICYHVIDLTFDFSFWSRQICILY